MDYGNWLLSRCIFKFYSDGFSREGIEGLELLRKALLSQNHSTLNFQPSANLEIRVWGLQVWVLVRGFI